MISIERICRVLRIRKPNVWLLGIELALTSAYPADAVPVAVVAGIIGATATSFVAIAVTALINIGLSVAFSALINAVSGSGKTQQQRQASVTTLALGENPRVAIFGVAAVGGTLNDAFNYGGTYGTDWEVMIVTLADHQCEGLVSFYVNDQLIQYPVGGFPDGYVPDQTVTGTDIIDGQPVTTTGTVSYQGQLRVWFLDGSPNRTLPDVVTNGGWAIAGNCDGLCTAVVAYKADAPDANNPVWSGGRPNFLWVVKGGRWYDARKDSSVGGSGAHRWADRSTWEWTDNPSVCRYNWVRGIYARGLVNDPSQLLIGRGLSSLEAPEANVFAYANICDEPVTLADGTTEKRYILGGVVQSNEKFVDTEKMFADAMGGIIIQPGGSVEVEPGHARSVTAYFTDDDRIVGTSVKVSPYRSLADNAWVNTVIPRYTEPAQKWQEHGAPIARVVADVVADGGPRELTLTLSQVSSVTIAQRLAEIQRRLGRLPITCQVTLGPRFCYIEEGDWVQWTSARHFSGRPVVFRVESYSIDEKWQITLTLRQILASVYDWSITAEQFDQSIIDGPRGSSSSYLGPYAITLEGLGYTGDPNATFGAPAGTPVGNTTADAVADAIHNVIPAALASLDAAGAQLDAQHGLINQAQGDIAALIQQVADGDATLGTEITHLASVVDANAGVTPNLLANGSFENGLDNWNGFGNIVAATGYGYGPRAEYNNTPLNTGGNDFQAAVSSMMAIQGGASYTAAADMMIFADNANAYAYVDVIYYRADQTTVALDGIQHPLYANADYSSDIDKRRATAATDTAPGDAAWAVLRWIINSGTGSITSVGIRQAKFERNSQATPYTVEGGLQSSNASIKNEQSVRASEDAVLATQISQVSASIVTRSNLVDNPTGDRGLAGWNNWHGGISPVAGTSGEGSFFYAGGQNQDSRPSMYQDIPYTSTAPVSIQAELYSGGLTVHSGTWAIVFVYPMFLDSNGNNIGAGSGARLNPGYGWTLCKGENYIPPAGTAAIRIYAEVLGDGTYSVDNVAWRRIKLESGTSCSLYTDDKSVSTVAASVTNTQSAVATLQAQAASFEQRLTAGSPNLLPNSSGEMGMSNWTSRSGTWSTDFSQWGSRFYCSPGQVSGYLYLDSDPFPIESQAWYTGQVEAEMYQNSATDRQFRIEYLWYSNANGADGFLRQDIGPTQIVTGAFKNAEGSHATFQSPAGAVVVRVRLVAFGTNVYWAAFRRCKIELGDKASAYSQEATVLTQAGVITDMEGRTEAYLRQSVVAGGSRAAVELYANGSTGGIEFQADAIRLGSAKKPALDTDSNGNVRIHGVLDVGTVSADQIVANGITYMQQAYSSQDWYGGAPSAGIIGYDDYGNPIYGSTDGSYRTLVSFSVYMDRPGDIMALAVAKQSYAGDNQSWQSVVRIDGVEVFQTGGIATSDSIALLGKLAVGSGNHTVEFLWWSTGPILQIRAGQATLTTMRRYV